MITQEILDYIKAQRLLGKADEEIRKILISAGGWSQNDVEESFRALAPKDTMVQPTEIPHSPTFNNPSPNAFVASATTQPIKKSKKLSFFIIGILFLAIMGGGVYAYSTGLISFFSKPPYEEGSLLSGVLEQATTIDTVTYTFAGSLNTNPIENGALPFKIDQEAYNDKLDAYERDVMRVRDVNKVFDAISYMNNYQQNEKIYPASIAELVSILKSKKSSSYYLPPTSDPNDNPYFYKRNVDGKGFTIKVDFETQEAIDQLKRFGGNSDSVITFQGKSATFTEKISYFYISSDLPKPYMVQLSEYMKSAPANLSFDAGLTGTFTTPNENKPSDWRGAFVLSGDFDDLTIKMEAEARKVDGDYYAIIEKFPSMFFFSMLSPIKGKWIKLTENEVSTSTESYYNYSMVKSLGREIARAETGYKENRKKLTEDMKLLVRLADEERVLSFRERPVQEKLNNQKLYKYSLELKKENLIRFLKRISEEMKTKNSELYSVIDADKFVTYLESKESAQMMDYVNENTFITFWTDGKGMPAKVEFRFRIVPPSDVVHLAGKQIDYAITLSLEDINQQIKVDVPDEYITAEEADELFNASDPLTSARQKGAEAAIKSNLSMARSVAEIYYDSSSSYAGVCKKEGRDTIYSALSSAQSLAGSETKIVITLANSGSFDAITCHDTADAWVAEAPLPDSKSGSPVMYCVDSSGNATEKKTVLKSNETSCR